MSAPRSIATMVLLALVLGVSSVAIAAGLLDGIYLVTLTAPSVDSFTAALIAIQNGSQIVIVLLDFLDNPLVFGVGQLSAQQQAAGSLLFSDGVQAGQFSVTFQGSNVTGTATLSEVQFALGGSKAF